MSGDQSDQSGVDDRSSAPSGWTLVRRNLARFAAHPWLTAWTLVATLLVMAAELTLPWVLGSAVEGFSRELQAENTSAITSVATTCALVYGGVALVGLVGRFAGGILRTLLIQTVLTDLRLSIHATLQGLAFRWHDRHSHGEILSRSTRDVEKIRAFYADVLANGGELFCISVGSILIISLMSPALGAIAALITTLVVLLVLHASAHLKDMWRKADDDYDEVTRSVQETVSGARVIRAFGREADEVSRFRGHTSTFVRSFLDAVNYWALRMPMTNAVFNISVAAVLVFGGMAVMGQQLELAVLVSSVFYLSAIGQKLRVLGHLVEIGQNSIASTERIVEMLDRDEVMACRGANALDVPRAPLPLTFDGVSFKGDGNRAILDDVSLEIPAGSTVAIVGPTGAGKSTLVSLIPRFHDPDGGIIRLGDADLRDYRLEDLRRSVALVFQDTFLFSATVAENIAFGRPQSTMDEIREAARQAQGLAFIENLPDGFDTVVGERGVTLSGGQKQRIAIARAYLIDPAILILDDATSALDSRTERSLQGSAWEVARGRTTLVIAHRYSSVQHCDRIVVLDQGRMIEHGTHEELLERGGLYSELYHGQLVASADETPRAPQTKSAELQPTGNSR